MKNKLRLIDISMLSSYMGRVLTVGVTLFVIVVAIAAYLSDGGRGIERGVIAICICAVPGLGDTDQVFEPFRVLLGRETRRPVIVTKCDGEQPAGFDLYILPVHRYFEAEQKLDIQALFEIQSTERQADKAVVVSKESAGSPEQGMRSLEDIVFSHPKSVNGFWVQAAMLEINGFEMPEDLLSLNFAGTVSSGARVISDVLCGAHRYGACKLSEVTTRIRDGSVRTGELHVWPVREVLPELVIAARVGESGYFSDKLDRVAKLLDEETSPAREDETVGLLRSRGVRRLFSIDAKRIGEVRRLFEDYGGVFDSTEVVRP
ncbi:MAG: hypothetical protein JSW50_09855 [Candidatus Latescibacterota bacterium]|nr:MAG: hypothetical protein JSW50_09855 [Candidatus Latescibacterota bacterium]